MKVPTCKVLLYGCYLWRMLFGRVYDVVSVTDCVPLFMVLGAILNAKYLESETLAETYRWSFRTGCRDKKENRIIRCWFDSSTRMYHFPVCLDVPCQVTTDMFPPKSQDKVDKVSNFAWGIEKYRVSHLSEHSTRWTRQSPKTVVIGDQGMSCDKNASLKENVLPRERKAGWHFCSEFSRSNLFSWLALNDDWHICYLYILAFANSCKKLGLLNINPST